MQEELALPKQWTLKEIYSSKFGCFPTEMPPEIRKAQVDAIQYIEKMSSLTNTDISTWNLFKVFESEWFESAPLVTDKAEINKRMLARELQDKRGVPDQLRKLDEDVEKTIKEHLGSERAILTSAARSAMRQHHQSASSKRGEYEELMSMAWKKRLLITELNNETKVDFTSRINEVLQQGFWEFHEYNDSKIKLRTKQDVILEHKNVAAGIDLRVNFGKFVAELGYTNFKLRVQKHENNLTSRGYYHPYVSLMGEICWGNMSYAADELYKAGNLPGLFELLGSLLMTYTPEATPYEPLEDFQTIYNDGVSPELQREGGTRPECEECGSEVDDCECYRCDYCAYRSTDERCGRHYCSICEGNRRECSCCGECDSTRDECTCCIVCEGTRDECTCCSVCEGNQEECGCCYECESSSDSCTRCGECYSHDGHTRNCSTNEQTTTEEIPS